jgi:hypothetical protein
VELLLCQCQLDDDSPLTREWAMWAIRNLTISNPEVQERIKVGAAATAAAAALSVLAQSALSGGPSLPACAASGPLCQGAEPG